MWNSTESGTSELVNAFMLAFRSYIPLGVTCRLEPPQGPTPGSDIIVEATVGRERVTFAVTLKDNTMPTTADRSASARQAGHVPLVLGRYLSPASRSALDRAEWSYWDTTGNVRIWSDQPVIVIDRQGAARDPDPSRAAGPRPLKSLGGTAAARVVLQLLREVSPVAVRDLASRAGVGVGTAARVVALLRDENFLTPLGSPAALIVDRISLLERWTRDYDFLTTNKAKRYRSPLGLDGAKAALERELAADGFAYSGLEAARRWLAYYKDERPLELPVNDLWLYASDRFAVERAAGLIADRRGDIVVAEGGFLRPGVKSEGSSIGLTSAYPWRVAGDLMSQPGRHAAIGLRLAEAANQPVLAP